METLCVPREQAGYAVYAASLEGVGYVKGKNFYRHHQDRDPTKRPLVIHPPLGNLWVGTNVLVHRVGLSTENDIDRLIGKSAEATIPAGISEVTKSAGVLDAPEMVCFPLKASLGYLKEALMRFEELRATDSNHYPLIIGHESTGTCKERTYSRVQEVKLQDFSKRAFGRVDFDFYSIKDSTEGIYEFVTFLLKQTDRWKEGDTAYNMAKGWEVVGFINEGTACFKMAERFERAARHSQSLVALDQCLTQAPVFYQADDILKRAKLMLASDLSIQQKKTAIKGYEDELWKAVNKNTQRDKPKGVIVLTGEIFHTEEMEAVSANLGKELVSRGYYFEKHSGIDHYLGKVDFSLNHLFRLGFKRFLQGLNPFYKDERLKLATRGGLSRDVGGHSLDIVALIEKVKEQQNRGRRKYDGIIEIMPFNCAPEVVASNVVNLRGVIYQQFAFDEQSAKAGVVTRLEGYLDRIANNKRRSLI